MNEKAHSSTRFADAIALNVGSRVGISALLCCCVLVLVMGAAAMKSSLGALNTDLGTMSQLMDQSYNGVVELNNSLGSLPQTGRDMKRTVKTVNATAAKAATTKTALDTLAAKTGSINSSVSSIATSTKHVQSDLGHLHTTTGGIGRSIASLVAQITPLVHAQRSLNTSMQSMGSGVSTLNNSLAYVIRILNYMAQPPTGGGFSVRVTLPKSAMPSIPGIAATVDPVQVFPRNAWKTYTGP